MKKQGEVILVNNHGEEEESNILLLLLPFWTPLIPPLGLASLKSNLQQHGFRVKVVDANIDEQFKRIYDNYFNSLREFLPDDCMIEGNSFYNIGNDLLQDHMMAHFNAGENKERYMEIVKIIISKSFYFTPRDNQVSRLSAILTDFYQLLTHFILELLEKENPQVLGISVYTHTLAASLFTLKAAKKKNPTIKTALGGGIFSNVLAPGSINLEFFLEKVPYVDKIFIGEGEILFLKYLLSELPENQRTYTLKDINYQIVDITVIENPDFSDLNLNYYPNFPSYTSRSCPFQCSFCSETIQWGKYRKKKTEQVARELVDSYQKYGHQLFWMCDSLLNPIATPLANQLIKTEIPIFWDGYLRADKDVCDLNNTMLWRRGGFYRARLGIESGSPKILQKMGKNTTIDQIKKALSNLAYAGIKTTTYWIVGYPGETEEDFLKTLALIKELQNEIYETMCNPFTYYQSGQVKSNEWSEQNRSLIYPEETKEMLILRKWALDGEPTREETFKRMKRFEIHCKGLGIPNPYSLKEINEADNRWKKLHRNAVPSLMEFKEKENITFEETRNIKHLFLADTEIEDVDEFDF